MSFSRLQQVGLRLTPLLLSAAAQAHSPYLKPNTFNAEEQRKHVTVKRPLPRATCVPTWR